MSFNYGWHWQYAGYSKGFMIKKSSIILGIIVVIAASLFLIIELKSADVNTFVKESSQEQKAVETATAHLSFPVTVIEVKKIGL